MKKCSSRSAAKNNYCTRDFSVLGLVALIIGIISIFAFVLPIKVWIFFLAGVLIFTGYKLYKL